MKGAKRVIGIDKITARLRFAEKDGIETVDFSEHSDVSKRLYELVPEGLDVALDCGNDILSFHPLKRRLTPPIRYFPRAKNHYPQSTKSNDVGD